MIKKNIYNNIILYESMVILFCAFTGLALGQPHFLFFVGIIDVLFFYSLFLFNYFKRGNITIIDIFIAFLFIYVLAYYFLFNTVVLTSISSVFGVKIIPIKDNTLAYVNFVFIVYGKVLFLPILDCAKHYNKKTIGLIQYNTTNNMYLIFVFIVYITYLLFLHIKFGSSYIRLMQSPMGDFYFSLISIGGWICSPLIVSSNLKSKWNNYNAISVLSIAIVILLALLGIRIYSLMIIFSLFINLQCRGININNNKVILFILFILFFILYQSLARIGIRDIKNLYSLFTLLGEFFFSIMSSYYLIGDPLIFLPKIRIDDLFIQILPSFFRSKPIIENFREYYIAKGYDPWPGGGLFLFGQIDFYFGFFGIVVLLMFSLFLSRINASFKKGHYYWQLPYLPVLFMVLFRYPIWLTKTVLFEAVAFVLNIAIANTIIRKGKVG